MEGIFVSSAFGEVLVHPGVDGRRHLAASAQLDVAGDGLLCEARRVDCRGVDAVQVGQQHAQLRPAGEEGSSVVMATCGCGSLASSSQPFSLPCSRMR